MGIVLHKVSVKRVQRGDRVFDQIRLWFDEGLYSRDLVNDRDLRLAKALADSAGAPFLVDDENAARCERVLGLRPPAPTELDPHAAADNSSRDLWTKLHPNPESIAAMFAVADYKTIRESPSLREDWQDLLDSALGRRIVDVRNALRDRGWSGERFAPLKKEVSGKEIVIDHGCRHVGAGRNVYAVDWRISDASGAKAEPIVVADDVDLAAEQFAERLEHRGLTAGSSALLEFTAGEVDGTRLREALQPGTDYDRGYIDAIESLALALHCDPPQLGEGIDEAIQRAVCTAVDAFANNADCVEEEDGVAASVALQAPRMR